MTENLAFERWCSTVDLDIQFHRDKQRYHYTTTQLAWAAWEARARSSKEPLQRWRDACECGCDACVALIETLGLEFRGAHSALPVTQEQK